MNYEPPDDSTPVILDSGYTIPDISEPVVLCADESGGRLQAELPPPEPPSVAMEAAARLEFRGAMDSQLPPPAAPTPTLEANALVAWASNLAAGIPEPRPPMDMAGALRQNLDLADNTASGVYAGHHSTMPGYTVPQLIRSQQSNQIRISRRIREQDGPARILGITMPATEADKLRRIVASPHQHGVNIEASSKAPHAEALRTRESTRERHQHGIKRRGNSGIPHAETIKRSQSVRLAEQQGLKFTKGLVVGNHNAWPAGTRLKVLWAKADHPAPGYWRPARYIPPGLRLFMPCDGDYEPRPLRCPVILGPDYEPQPPCETDPEPPHETIVIPIREVYSVINEVIVTELDGTPIPAQGFNASIDFDSWTWSWSTRVPGSSLSQVQGSNGEQIEINVKVNDETLRLLVEKISRERTFGESWVRVSGRGHAATIASPRAPQIAYTNDTALTALQILDDAFKENGVSIGWTFDWQIQDWQVPSNVFSETGSWMDLALRVAEAGGAYVQSHDTDKILKILPRYPYKPWSWDADDPDVILPEDVVQVEGVEWSEKPPYNGVWVHGGEQGRADRILVGSSGGTYMAPTIVDALATDLAMTIQRGTALLGEGGAKASVSLKLPVLSETGLIRPGTFLQYDHEGQNRKGLVRSLSISHDYPQLWQTLEVETNG